MLIDVLACAYHANGLDRDLGDVRLRAGLFNLCVDTLLRAKARVKIFCLLFPASSSLKYSHRRHSVVEIRISVQKNQGSGDFRLTETYVSGEDPIIKQNSYQKQSPSIEAILPVVSII